MGEAESVGCGVSEAGGRIIIVRMTTRKDLGELYSHTYANNTYANNTYANNI